MVRYWAGHIATVAVAAGLTYVLGEGARYLMNGNLAHLNQAKDSLISLAEYGLWLAEAGYLLAKIPQVQDQERQLTREMYAAGTGDVRARMERYGAERQEIRQPLAEDVEDTRLMTRAEIEARRLNKTRRMPW